MNACLFCMAFLPEEFSHFSFKIFLVVYALIFLWSVFILIMAFFKWFWLFYDNMRDDWSDIAQHMWVRYCFKMHQGFCFYLCTVKPFDTSASLTMLKPLTVWITTNCGKFLKTWDTLPPFCENCMPVKKQQLEPVGEQWTGSKLRKEYIKAIYCHCFFNFYAE